MNLTPTQIAFLQALVADAPVHRSTSLAAAYMAQHFHIGQQYGRRFEYTDDDLDRARRLLLAQGLNIQATPAGLLNRADAAARAGFGEKVGTVAPHADSVACILLGKTARTGQGMVHPAPLGYLVASAQEIASIEVNQVLVVENFETFRQLRSYAWVLEALPQHSSTMALYRGDPRLRVDDAAQTLRMMPCSKWAFFDFDPSGLSMAASIEGLDRLLLPQEQVLETVIRRHQRVDLWDSQYEGVWHSLETCSHPGIVRAWGWMKHWKMGCPQEWMRDI